MMGGLYVIRNVSLTQYIQSIYKLYEPTHLFTGKHFNESSRV